MIENRLFLIMGVSGVGKTTIIKQLLNLESRFSYVRPFTDRRLRPDELDKIYKDAGDILDLEKKNPLFIVNRKYSHLYAVDIGDFYKLINNCQIPIIDWPIEEVEKLTKTFRDEIVLIYIMPPNIETLISRLTGRKGMDDRFQRALEELDTLDESSFYNELKIYKNEEGLAKKIAGKIIKDFMHKR